MSRNYAHLLGFGRQAAAARAEEESDEDRKKREDEEEAARKAKVKKAQEDETDEERKKREDEEEKAKAEEEKKKDDAKKAEEDKKKDEEAKKARKASDGDEEDEEDEADMKARSARARERARCAAIFDSPHAATNLVGACHLAFGTSLPRSQVVSMLAAMGNSAPAPAAATKPRDALRERMQGEPSANVGAASPPAPTGSAGLAAAIVASHRKATGEA